MLGEKDVQDFLGNYDIIILAETMKNSEYEVKFPNYKSFHHARKSKHHKAKRYGGGILILITETLCKHVKVEPKLKHLVWLTIFNKFDIAVVYIPPESSTYMTENALDYFETLYAEIERKMAQTELVYVCGDANARTANLIDYLPDEIGPDYQPLTNDRLNCDKTINKYGRRLIDMCKSTGLQILNGREPFQKTTNKFSCHKWNGKSCPDVLLTLPNGLKFIENFHILERKVDSDHNPLTFNIRHECVLKLQKKNNQVLSRYKWEPEKRQKYIQSFRGQNEANKSLLEDFLCNISDESKNSDEIISSFYEFVREKIETNFKKVKPKLHSTFPSNKWFDNELKHKKSILKKSIKLGVGMIEERILRAEYKRLIQKKKREYYNKVTLDLNQMSSNNPNEYWKFWKDSRKKNSGENLHIGSESFTDYYKNGMKQNMSDLLKIIDDIVTDDSFGQIQTPLNKETIIANDILNGPISENEVKAALHKAKPNKACGCDGIPIEFFKYCNGELVKPMMALFNRIFESGVFPKQWSLGMINPIYKHKEKDLAENYRKVTLLPALGKCFESILNNRLIFCKSALMTHDPLQNGFNSDARAIDNTFILNGLIEKQTALKRPLYIAFVDFKSAFDKIGRNALLFKMHSQYIKGKFIKIIRNMLSKSKSQVKWNGELGEIFENFSGVLQGSVISPTLFKIFLEDLPNYLGSDIGVKVGDTLINYLLHADDLILIAETHVGLQILLDRLDKFCKRWDMIVNLLKTKIMIFNRKYKLNNSDDEFRFDGGVLEETERYKYLGTIISNQSKDPFKHNYRFLREKAIRAIYALRMNIRQSIGTSLPIKLMIKSFEVQIRPIIDYGAELWTLLNPISDIEYVQNFFLKTALHVREQTPTLALLGELGRFPLYLKQHDLLLRYFKRLQTLDKSKIVYKMYEDLVNLDLKGHKTWVTKARKIYNLMTTSDNSFIHSQHHSDIVANSYANHTHNWLKGINDHHANPKLRLYCLFKSELKIEDYFSVILNDKHIIALLRYRTSSHSLNIELGRHTVPPTPIEKRTCEFCSSNAIDDEIHLLIDCKFHHDERNVFHSHVKDVISLSNLSKKDIFAAIMSCNSPILLKALAKFIYICFERRKNNRRL